VDSGCVRWSLLMRTAHAEGHSSRIKAVAAEEVWGRLQAGSYRRIPKPSWLLTTHRVLRFFTRARPQLKAVIGSLLPSTQEANLTARVQRSIVPVFAQHARDYLTIRRKSATASLSPSSE
jgi:hypothetical protein